MTKIYTDFSLLDEGEQYLFMRNFVSSELEQAIFFMTDDGDVPDNLLEIAYKMNRSCILRVNVDEAGYKTGHVVGLFFPEKLIDLGT